jgi:predicted nucleic acid-binding protein
MIHLDTNYLIALTTLSTPQGKQVQRWIEEGERLGVSAIVWTEFRSGSIGANQIRLLDAIIQRIIPFGQTEADLAAMLYNFAGRKREKRLDCMIAATAITGRASLATLNQKDFATFKLRGLVLA